MTLAVARVLREFLADPLRPRHGYDLMRATGFPSGKLYPVLAKLTHAGWLIREEEDIDPFAEGRPARRLYRLADPAVTRYALNEVSQQIAPPPMDPAAVRMGGSV